MPNANDINNLFYLIDTYRQKYVSGLPYKTTWNKNILGEMI